MSAEAVDRARIVEFLDTIGARLDEIYAPDNGNAPTIYDVLDDPRDHPLADNSPGVQYALGWIRGAAEMSGQTVLEFLWDFDISEEDLSSRPRRAPFQPKPKRRGRKQPDRRTT